MKSKRGRFVVCLRAGGCSLAGRSTWPRELAAALAPALAVAAEAGQAVGAAVDAGAHERGALHAVVHRGGRVGDGLVLLAGQVLGVDLTDGRGAGLDLLVDRVDLAQGAEPHAEDVALAHVVGPLQELGRVLDAQLLGLDAPRRDQLGEHLGEGHLPRVRGDVVDVEAARRGLLGEAAAELDVGHDVLAVDQQGAHHGHGGRLEDGALADAAVVDRERELEGVHLALVLAVVQPGVEGVLDLGHRRDEVRPAALAAPGLALVERDLEHRAHDVRGRHLEHRVDPPAGERRGERLGGHLHAEVVEDAGDALEHHDRPALHLHPRGDLIERDDGVVLAERDAARRAELHELVAADQPDLALLDQVHDASAVRERGGEPGGDVVEVDRTHETLRVLWLSVPSS